MSILKVISNTNQDHRHELQKLLNEEKVERLVIASPFLSKNVTELLKDFSFKGVDSFELITTFKPGDTEQITKPSVLKVFFKYFKENYPSTKFQIHIDNKLHGKIYIFITKSSRNMIVSSANFTKNGLSHNHEWGLKTNDNRVIDDVINDLFQSIEYEDVTQSQIDKACLIADQYMKDNKDMRDHQEWTKTKPDILSYIDILKQVYSVDDTSNTDPQYFLKPIGDKDSPVLLEEKDRWDFTELHKNLHFSKKKPKGVRKGDVVITRAVGSGVILSYYRVTGGLQAVTQKEIEKDKWKERWPWYMEGRNLAVPFAEKWWSHKILCDDALVDEFKKDYPDKPVTYVGGFSLGTLNFGNDKVKITKEFGDFIISKIKNASGECKE